MHRYKLYLAGPVTGLSYKDAINWRNEVSELLIDDFDCVSPLRGYDVLTNENNIKPSYENSILTTQRAIMFRNCFDVSRIDGMFVCFLNTAKVSIGTIMEISLAHWLRKPIVLVMDNNNVHNHPMIMQSTPYVVNTINDGIKLVKDIFLH